MPRCNVCNDLVLEVLPVHRPSCLSLYGKSFVIEMGAKELEQAAASGCVPCSVVLQAIVLYAPRLHAVLVQTGGTSEAQITLSGNGNEPLSIRLLEGHPHFQGVRLPAFYLDFELFEEWDYSENHAPLFSAVGLCNTPPEVLDITYAGWRAKRWISRCDDEHECGGEDIPCLPTRVLAITSDPIKLIVCPSGTTPRFAALSYCWGSTGNLITTSNNIEEREAGIKWETLPNLFQDVVQITRQMGIHFLWIDALCIIQDDQADWQRESSNMGGIYAGACVTIACDSAADTSYRLTNPRNCALGPGEWKWESAKRDDSLKALAPVIIDGHAHSFFVRQTLYHQDILREPPLRYLGFPLMIRGWTLQERLLSRRILHFTAHEMVWECQKTFYCECGGIPRDSYWRNGTAKASFERAKAVLNSDRTTSLPNLTCPGDTLRNESFVRCWTGLMAAYTSRRLTFESDRLPGISAIARNFGLAKAYIAGLWLEDLPWHMAWSVDRPWDHMRPSSYDGPTWSWASSPAKVTWRLGRGSSESLVRVIEASTAPVGLDEFGQVAWGKVRLQARVAAAKALNRILLYPLVVTSYGEYPFNPDFNTSFEGEKGQVPSAQRSARTVEEYEDIWVIPVLVGEFGDEPSWKHWFMVVAKPERHSLQRALLDPNSEPETLMCERIGCFEFTAQSSRDIEMGALDIRKWFASTQFKTKEIIII